MGDILSSVGISPYHANIFPSFVISPDELDYALSNPQTQRDTRIVPVAAGRASALPSFESMHIPGSVFFDMDRISDTTSAYPVMMPTSTEFAKSMDELGILPEDTLVVYDRSDLGLYFAPRVAWACLYFGHQKVHVLNSFSSYAKEGGAHSVGKLSPLKRSDTSRSYALQAVPDRTKVISFEELCDFIQAKDETYQIIDARPSSSFWGSGSGVKGTTKSGHMPSALNVPLASILDSEKNLLPAQDLKAVFTRAGVNYEMPAILTCNSGVTACAIEMALRVSGYGMETRLYDGSWAEWSEKATAPGLIVTAEESPN